MYACEKFDLKTVELLLNNDSNVNLQNLNGFTALMLACDICNLEKTYDSQTGSYSIIKSLLKNKPDVNLQNSGGWTALMYACKNSFLDAIFLLVSKNSDVNLQDLNGFTALMLACENSDLDTVKLLIKKGSNVNLQNDLKHTALTIATLYPSSSTFEIVKVLLENGADPNLCDINGDNALMITIQMYDLEDRFKLINLLVDKVVNFKTTNILNVD
jgi:ankyrin repeat protein